MVTQMLLALPRCQLNMKERDEQEWKDIKLKQKGLFWKIMAQTTTHAICVIVHVKEMRYGGYQKHSFVLIVGIILEKVYFL